MRALKTRVILLERQRCPGNLAHMTDEELDCEIARSVLILAKMDRGEPFDTDELADVERARRAPRDPALEAMSDEQLRDELSLLQKQGGCK